MRKLICAAALATVFAAPAMAQNSVSQVTQVTSFGSNAGAIIQSNRNVSAALGQSTIVGNNSGLVAQFARNSSALVGQETVVGNNAAFVSQIARFRR